MAKRDDEEPRPKPKKRRADDAEDGGGGEKKAKPKSGAPLLLIALVGGGLVALLLCCAGTGVGAYFIFFSGPSIAGKWEQNDALAKREWEFDRGGTGKVKVTQQNLFVKGKVDVFTVHYDYKLIAGDPLVMEMTATRAEGDVFEGVKREIGRTFRFTIVQTPDTLTVTRQDDRQAGKDTVTMKRVR